MKKKLIVFLTLIAVLFTMFAPAVSADTTDTKKETGDFELHMLSVGEGLSILIRDKDKYLLYDGGDASASSTVVAYLKNQGVKTLDYIVVSHYDADHLNGIIGALHAFEVKTILEPDYDPDNDLYRSYDSAADDSDAERIFPKAGDVYKLNKAEFTVVGPKNYKAEDVNDRCIAIHVKYQDRKILICADAGEAEELEILNSQDTLKSDVYVVDHHGGASSSTDLFLGNVKPKYALLSCGKDNTYGHPAERVLESLKKLNCELYRTDIQGAVVLESDGREIFFNTEPAKDWSPGKAKDPASGGEETASEDGTAVSQEPAAEVLPPAIAEDTAEESDISEKSAPEEPAVTYICNTNTGKFHYPWCNSVNSMKDKNKLETTESRDSLIAQGYEPCGNCHP